MPISYSLFKFDKGRPKALVTRAKKAAAAAEERACRKLVDQRDGRRCRYPTCCKRATQKHHLVKRSQLGRWVTANICSLCPEHHMMIHDGKLKVSGNADRRLTWKWTA